MKTMLSMPTWLPSITEADINANSEHLPAWFTHFRLQAWQDFLKTSLPTPKNERWKYADLNGLMQQSFSFAQKINTDVLAEQLQHLRSSHEDRILLLIVNGQFIPELSDLDKLPKKVIACHLQQALYQEEALVKQYWPEKIDAAIYPFAALSTALANDGLFFYVPKEVTISQPLHLLSLSMENESVITNHHHLVIMGENTTATLIEEYFSLNEKAYVTNSLLQVVLETSAQLTHYKLQAEETQAFYFSCLMTEQQAHSSYSLTQFTIGASFSREDIAIQLKATGAECRTAGFYQANQSNQYIDYHLDVHHAAPRTTSEMLYKGIVAQQARAVFNGKLLVDKGSQKIVAYQANHNLLLSPRAEVYSKPELEIYADDVKCKHGATTGQLNQDALFYLRARGIPQEEATAILLEGFREEILARIQSSVVRTRIKEALR
jgi:Fe-S cluster assembly protein SufD